MINRTWKKIHIDLRLGGCMFVKSFKEWEGNDHCTNKYINVYGMHEMNGYEKIIVKNNWYCKSSAQNNGFIERWI